MQRPWLGTNTMLSKEGDLTWSRREYVPFAVHLLLLCLSETCLEYFSSYWSIFYISICIDLNTGVEDYSSKVQQEKGKAHLISF